MSETLLVTSDQLVYLVIRGFMAGILVEKEENKRQQRKQKHSKQQQKVGGALFYCLRKQGRGICQRG